MRVITGSARGRRLETLKGADVRPTTDRVKEAVFSVLQFRIEGRSFLDLFAGSGQMAIEALSRGAKKAYIVDSSRKAHEVIRKNLEACGLLDKAEMRLCDSLAFLEMADAGFDIAFLDPPYGSGLIQQALPILSKKMNRSGIILCETQLNEKLPEEAGDFVLDRTYCYGKIKVTAYKIPGTE